MLYNKFEADKYFQICLLVFFFGSKTKSGFVLWARWKSKTESSEIIKSVNDALDGSGGGRADFAQGGSSQKESVDEMVTKLKGLFKG